MNVTPDAAYEVVHDYWTARMVTGQASPVPLYPAEDSGFNAIPGQRPARPYATYRLLSLPRPDAKANYVYASGEADPVRQTAQYNWTVSLQVFGVGALNFLARFAAELETGHLDSIEKLQELNLGFGGVILGPNPIAIPLETKFEARAQVDLRFNAAGTFSLDRERIRKAELELEISRGATVLETDTFETEELP